MANILHRLFILIFILSQSFLLQAQSKQWTIQVVDSISLQPISYATLYSAHASAISNDSGIAILQSEEPTLLITISSVGYQKKSLNLTTQDQSTDVLMVKMRPIQHILEEISVVGGKFERRLLNDPSTVEVLKPDFVRSTASYSLDEVLDKVPGIQMIDGQANIRGGSGYSYGAGSRVLLTVDDVPAMQADAGLPNWGDIPLENMSQIEVLKGAGSVLYGSAAMNGVINFRTAYAGTLPRTRISTQFTGYLSPTDARKNWWSGLPFKSWTSISHAQKFKSLELVAGGSYNHEDGYNKGMSDHTGRLFANTLYHFNSRLSLQLNALINKGRSENFVYWSNDSTGAYIGDTSTTSTNNKTRFYIDPVLTFLGKNNTQHKLIGRYYSVNNDSDHSYAQKSAMEYGEYRFLKRFEDLELQLTSGVVYTGTQVKAALYGDSAFSSTNLAAFIQLDKVFFDKLTVSAGGRYEYNQLRSPEIIDGVRIPEGKTTESKPVFKVGLNYQLSRYSSVRANWGQGYRYPTIAEKFVSTTAGAIRISPNAALASENGWTAELGYKQGVKVRSWMGYLDLSVFRSEYDNMIEFLLLDFSKGFQSFNVGDTRVQGFEATLQGRGTLGNMGLTLLTGYTYIDPTYRNFEQIDTLKSTSNANILKYRMKHAVRADLSVSWQSWQFGFNYVYNSSMLAIDKIFDLVIPGVHNFRADHNTGFHVFGLRVARSFYHETLTTGIYLNNVFNREYTYRPGLLEAPRNISLKIDLNLSRYPE